MATATIAACDTATIVLVAPPEDFEMPSLRGDLVPVQIGSNETSPLHVHTTILTKNSEFFKNAMKPECRADPTKPINVPNVMLTIFEAYCGWLYTGKVVHHMKDQRYRFLASLYVLGETLMDTAFQDVIVAATIRYSIDYKTFPGNRPLQTIYAGTPANSPARRLMVDFWMFRAHPTWEGLGHLTKTTCTDFVNDLVRELVMKRDIPTSFAQRPWVANPESYRIDGEAK